MRVCDVRRPLGPIALSNHGGGGGITSLKCMEISENKFRLTEHGSIELRWLYMWDPDYSDSELSGKSRDSICPYTQANSAAGAPRRVTKDNKCCWNGRRHPDLWPNSLL